jgi:glycosyltransferase involved in cell wall biosynthesis
MKILFVSKWLRITGGVETSALAAAGGLRRAGHEVAWFGFGDERDPAFPVVGDLPREFSLRRHGGLAGARLAFEAAVKLFWNPEVARTYARSLDVFRPDIVQLHNVFHHLGPRMQLLAVAHGIPVAAFAHDYHPVCPNYTLLRGERVPCDARCGRNTALHALVHRCVRRSVVSSALSAAEFGLSKLRGAYAGAVGLWIAPSAFLAEMLCAGGIPRDRIVHIEYCLDPSWRSERVGERALSRFLYVGRLSYEKGLRTVLEMARRMPVAQFVIAGGGPLETQLQAEARNLAGVTFLGPIGQDEVKRELSRATALIVPSRWHENSPMVIREALASGVPVVASRMGGIPELVTDGSDGFLCEAGDVDAFVMAAQRFTSDPGLSQRMGEAGVRKATQRWSVELHAGRLLAAYKKLLEQSGRGVEPAPSIGSP